MNMPRRCQQGGTVAIVAIVSMASVAILVCGLLGSGWRWMSPATYDLWLSLMRLLPSSPSLAAVLAQQDYVSLAQAKLLADGGSTAAVLAAGLFGFADWSACVLVWGAVLVASIEARRLRREASVEDRGFELRLAGLLR